MFRTGFILQIFTVDTDPIYTMDPNHGIMLAGNPNPRNFRKKLLNQFNVKLENYL
jgi:hypothetical protein